MSTVREAVSAGQCVTRSTQVRHIASNLTHGTGASTGETIYFGSPQSQTLLRIYDKRLELQSKGQEHYHDYGTRWELELKKDRAEQCARALASLDEADWKEFVENGAFKDTFMTGKEFNDWLGRAEATHKALMQEAGFIAK